MAGIEDFPVPNLITETTSLAEAVMIRRDWLVIRLAEQEHRCAYCTRRISLMPETLDRRATVDHRIAISVGGADHFDNVVAACQPCNQTKGSGTVEDLLVKPRFRQLLAEGQREVQP